MKTILIVGLGNPGKKYEYTRHNAGFALLDYLQKTWGFPEWEWKKKFDAHISAKTIPGKNIILLKPQTFMNLSGRAVSAVVKYYSITLDLLIAVHDEIDLPLGKWRISTNSTAAGHNGVQNIIDLLKSKNFTRLRLGIENRREKDIPTEKYVLERFRSSEKKIFQIEIREAAEKLHTIFFA